MAKQIKRTDIVEDDIFKVTRESAEATLVSISKLNDELKESAKILSDDLNKALTNTSQGINSFVKASQQANKLKTDSVKLDEQEIKVRQQLAKLAELEEKQRLQKEKADGQAISNAQKLQREQERQAKALERQQKAAKDADSAYKQLERNTRELKNQSKELAAQMLVLEKSGKRGSKEWRELAAKYKDVTRAAQDGDKALKKIDSTVGDNFRNVGNYKDAIGGLKNMLGSLGLAFGIGEIVRGATQSIIEFDQSIADLVSITGASGSDLEFFKQQAIDLGKEVQGGASAVVEAYKLIGSAKPELLSNAAALNEVTKSAITLSQASGMELPDAATALTDALNQFGAPAEEAGRFIDALANGALFGSAEIPQVTEALLKFGAVANTANVSLEESTGLIEALAEKGLKGAEAGTALRNVMLKLSAPDALPKEAKDRLDALGISFADLQDTSKPFAERLDALKPLLNDNAALVKVFGTENAVAATNLLSNTDRIKELTAQMATQGTATKQAEDRTNTLSFALNELKESWNGYILGAASAADASGAFIGVVKFLSENLATILDTIVLAAKYYGIWRAATLAQIAVNKLLETSSKDAFTAVGNGLKSIGNFLKTNAISIFITAMVSGFMKIKSILDELNAPFQRITELNNNLASISQRASEKLGEEKASLQLLVGQIKAHNAGSKERGDLLQELNNKYGTHLKNISDETTANRQLDAAQKAIISNMKNQILLQARQEKYVEVIKAVQSAEDEYNKAIFQNRTKINKLSADEVNKWIERLAGATSYGDKLRNLSEAEKRRYLIEDNLSSEQLAKKQALEQLQKRELVFEKQLKNQMDENTAGVNVNTAAYNGNTSSTDKNKESKKQLKTEIDAVNESLSKQNELLAKIDEIQARRAIEAKQGEIDIKLANDLKYASETGDIQVDALEKLIEEKYALERAAIEKQGADKLTLLEQQYTEESRKEREALIEKRDELLKQENLTAEAKEKIKQSYNDQLEQIEQNDLQRNADLELEKIILADETNQQLVQLEKEKNDEINDVNDQLIGKQKEYYDQRAEKSKETTAAEIEAEKEAADRRIQIAQAITDYAIEQSNKRIDQIEKEKAAAEAQADYLRELAAQGNINAKESLAEQNKIIAEAERQKQQELKRQERIQFANTVYQTYQKNASDDSVKNPLAKTISDVTLLTQFIKAFPAFLDGTEDTGTNGQGIDGKGGFHAILHPNERVMTKEQNALVGNLSNEDLAKIANDYNTGRIIAKGDNAQQIGGAWQAAAIVKKLDELSKIIEHKPETNIELGQILDGAMTIIKSQKKGNSIVYNRFKIK
jgi:TP901 family phage tail tape measure protein